MQNSSLCYVLIMGYDVPYQSELGILEVKLPSTLLSEWASFRVVGGWSGR